MCFFPPFRLLAQILCKPDISLYIMEAISYILQQTKGGNFVATEVYSRAYNQGYRQELPALVLCASHKTSPVYQRCEQ